MRNSITIIAFLITFVFLVLPPGTSAYTRLLWERDLSEALTNRDEYFQKIGIVNDDMAFSRLWTPKSSNSLLEQLAFNIDPLNPWYHFLTGILHAHTSSTEAANDFHQAVACAEDNPGALWLLFYEFKQAKQHQWAETCLQRLEKYFLAIGAQSSPVISQQLLAFAIQGTKTDTNPDAEKYFDWSSRFEKYPLWQEFTHGLSFLPHHPMTFIHSCFNCLALIRSSWFLQATLLHYCYQWFRAIGMAFICIVLFIISIEILPIALHPVMSFFPTGLHARVRWIFTFAMYLSLASLGILPFLLATTIILWFRVEGPRRILLAVVLGILALSPLDARIQSLFNNVLSPNSTLGLFRRAVAEGWHSDLEIRLRQNEKSNPDDFLAHTAVAILALKRNDLQAATTAIQKAESLQPLDPVTLTTAGNCYFTLGNTEKAHHYYQKSIDQVAANASTLFNIGQLNVSLMNTSEGTRQMTKAAEFDPTMVNTFIEKNATYFSTTWPRLRQFIQPDYTTAYFWQKIFPRYWGSWENATIFWGPAMFGMSPLIFLIVGILLFIVMISLRLQPSRSNLTFCKLCGNPMCHKCRTGPICHDCAHTTQHAQNETVSTKIKLHIVYMKHLKQIFISHLLNIVFPGAKKITQADQNPLKTIGLLFATSVLYATYYMLMTATFAVPFWAVSNLVLPLGIVVSLYPFLFAVQSIQSFQKEIKTLRGTHGTSR